MPAGYVAIIGKPNAGKSTLLNGILGQKLSIVTAKAQTTRHRIIGLHSEDNFQIIFLDTPGVLREPSTAVSLQQLIFAHTAGSQLMHFADNTSYRAQLRPECGRCCARAGALEHAGSEDDAERPAGHKRCRCSAGNSRCQRQAGGGPANAAALLSQGICAACCHPQ